jgi:hypothetical protein
MPGMNGADQHCRSHPAPREVARSRRALRKRGVLGVLAAVLLLAGCAGSSTASVSWSPTASPTAALLSQSFDSTVGPGVRYPASWEFELLADPHVGERGGAMQLTSPGRSAVVRITQTQPGRSRAASASRSDLARLRAQAARRHAAILHSGFLTVHGVRLAEVEYESAGRHYLTLTSAGSSAGRPTAQVTVTAACPTGQWLSQRATVMAILDSLSFHRPGA